MGCFGIGRENKGLGIVKIFGLGVLVDFSFSGSIQNVEL